MKRLQASLVFAEKRQNRCSHHNCVSTLLVSSLFVLYHPAICLQGQRLTWDCTAHQFSCAPVACTGVLNTSGVRQETGYSFRAFRGGQVSLRHATRMR